MADPNKATSDYIKSYLSRKDPGFAVLLAGPWGAGKTHLIKKLIKDDDTLYISLFGVSSTEDIERALLIASMPMLDNELVKSAGRISAVAIKFFNVDINAKDFVKLKLPDILIFDDLERTMMKPKEILGAINGFVEHEGKGVILLANEERLFSKKTRKEKEKLIGQTLTVVANIDEALKEILKKIDTEPRKFLEDQHKIIKTVFRQAGFDNLRSLTQALWEFGRFYNAIDPKLREKLKGMQALLKVFLALTLEVKAGRLGREDLALRGRFDIPLEPDKADDASPPILTASKRYPDVEVFEYLDSGVFPTNIAIEVILDGKVNTKAINDTLRQTEHFADKNAEPEWRTVWYAWHRDAEDVKSAYIDMKAKIGGREYTDPAVVLHVLGVWLNTVEIGLETKPIDKIEAECIDYINAIATAGKLPAATGGYDGYGYDRGSSLGLGYPHGDSPRGQAFQRLFDHMRATQDRLLRESYPAICETLLSWMADDLETFVYQLSGNAPYSLFPVLRDMPVDKFVKQLDKLQNDAQTNVYETLNSRIYSGRSDLELKHEKPWVKTLIKHLQSRADGLSGVEKWQAQSHLDHYLKSNKGRD